MANLWLFDIDGTLVDIRHMQIAATQKDYQAVLGLHISPDVVLGTFGMSEAESLKSIFQAMDVSYDDILIRKMVKVHSHNFAEILATNKIMPLEGVVEILTYLKNDKEYLGVVTGNLEEPARLILERAGLNGFFSILSCDDGKSERKDIVKRAIDAAKTQNYHFGRVIIVGDTTKDIDAGRYANAFTVAVATGTDSYEKLQASAPDIILPTLKDYRRVFEMLRG